MSEVTTPSVELYDTTLRDGAQRADLSYTIEDRLRILHRVGISAAISERWVARSLGAQPLPLSA